MKQFIVIKNLDMFWADKIQLETDVRNLKQPLGEEYHSWDIRGEPWVRNTCEAYSR